MQDHLGANILHNFRIYELWIFLNWGQLFCRYFTWIFAAQISFQIRNFWLSIFVIGESRLTFWYEDFWRKYPWQFPAMNICPISRNPQPNIFFDPPCTLNIKDNQLQSPYLYIFVFGWKDSFQRQIQRTTEWEPSRLVLCRCTLLFLPW